MSPTRKLTVSAVVAALCTVLLFLASVIGQVRLAIIALAGIVPAAVVILCGMGWAVGCSAAAGLLAFLLLPDKSPALWFFFFFGHYPIWKMLIERLQTKRGKPLLGWILKIAGFFACMALFYFLFRDLFFGGIPASMSGWVLGFLAAALLACFVVYDIAFSILIGYFRINIMPKLK